jgi:hypothetical protein
MTTFSLAHLTVLNLAPPQMVRVAARTGYHYIGLRMIAVTDTTPGYPLMHEPSMMRDTKAALADTRVRVLDIEFVKITPEIDVAGLERFVGGRRGARRRACDHRSLRPRPCAIGRPTRRHHRPVGPIRPARRAGVLPLDRCAGPERGGAGGGGGSADNDRHPR